MLKANALEIDITPALGTIINGEFTNRYAQKIADPLYAKAIYLQSGDMALLWIMVDICVMRREFLDPIKHEIEQLTGISKEHQLIASTHTHYGGSVADLLLAHADMAYRSLLHERLIQLAKDVTRLAVPAKIGFQKISKPEHLTCRRYKMKESYVARNPISMKEDRVKTNPFGAEHLIVERQGLPDGELPFIAIKTLSDDWIGMLANYNLHYVGDCERSTITADYFGHFSRKVKENIQNEAAVIMMSNGTSGEVNIWDFIDGDRYPKEFHAKSKCIGEDLADAVCAQLSSVSWESTMKLEVGYVEAVLPIRPIDQEDLARAYQCIEQTVYEGIQHTDPELMEKVYAREQVLLQQYPATIRFPIQCFKLGNKVIGALGGEFFTETGKLLKADPNYFFTICLANDYVGYVPPRHEFEFGGYETWRARSSFLAEEAEELIRFQLTQLTKA